MKYVHILVEGQTEETFVRDVVQPHLLTRGIFLNPVLITTKRVKAGADFKGGVTSYGKIRNDLRPLLHDTNAVRITTMLDYYALPADFPRYDDRPVGTCFERAAFLEQAFRDDIRHWRFLPYLALHEFEALMFVSPDDIARAFPDADHAAQLHKIRNAYKSPEEIDEDQPPSKRLRKLFPRYQKPLHGPLVTLDIGIARLREECVHFDQWLQQLEALSE
ncbi:MAG: DUF4276 family protein [Anaerolineae bacterium]|nr:DUF4276 family protein [Anaerolineae bacterium]